MLSITNSTGAEQRFILIVDEDGQYLGVGDIDQVPALLSSVTPVDKCWESLRETPSLIHNYWWCPRLLEQFRFISDNDLKLYDFERLFLYYTWSHKVFFLYHFVKEEDLMLFKLRWQ